ncbi:amino acid permease [Teratosphaeria destructans]|uniref:Amino acid permease n=1 Tax=Teratosphaeria destructans TaxID=418781 RepID=A0A9W7SJR8_9PEZI|nr:amino acid permease [Teratosphaeria destructans]
MLNYKTGPGKACTYLIDISGSATSIIVIAWAVTGSCICVFDRPGAHQDIKCRNCPDRALLYPHGTMLVIFVTTFLVSPLLDTLVLLKALKGIFVASYIVMAVFILLYASCGKKDSIAAGSSFEEEKHSVSWSEKMERLMFS